MTLDVQYLKLRKDSSNVTRHALDWNPGGHRKKGRPKNTWRRDLNSDLQKIGKTCGEAKKIAKNMRKWKATVVALCLSRRNGLSQARSSMYLRWRSTLFVWDCKRML